MTVDSTVQPKAIAYPVDSRLLEIARGQLVKAAKDVGIALNQEGLIVGARTFAGNPYDGHVLSAQLEQTGILLQDAGAIPREVIVDLLSGRGCG